MILLRSDGAPSLPYHTLEPLPRSPQDTTTESVSLRLHLQESTLDIHNFYLPPIRPSATDTRHQAFSATTTFGGALGALPEASLGCLLAGDFNQHALDWDPLSPEDALGMATAEWCDENACLVANTGEPTFVVEGTSTAPDVTITSGSLRVLNWRTLPSIGRCGHKVLLYDIQIELPYSPWPSRPRARPLRTSISWRKVDWADFNTRVEHFYTQHPLRSATPSVHNLTKALTNAFQLASKRLPRGCRPDPVSWVTPEVQEAMERRDHLRLTAEVRKQPED